MQPYNGILYRYKNEVGSFLILIWNHDQAILINDKGKGKNI